MAGIRSVPRVLPLERAARVFRAALVCALGLLSAHGVSASELEAKPLHLVSTQAYTYRSKIMDRSYDVIVSVPQGYESNPQTKYPVLLLTDGHNTFPLAFGAWSYLAESGEIRQPILVSIGSPATEGRAASYRRRLYEFSPPDWPMTDPAGKVLAERIAAFCTSGNRSVSEACTGGAPRFFKFLTTELLPELVKSYRIEADDLGLYGHSAGGFFALWVMFQGDDRFKRFIVSSPAMAYGDGEIFRLEAQYAARHDDLPVRIYLASGTNEMIDPLLEGVGRTVSGQIHLGGKLAARKYPGLELFSEVHQDFGHMDVPGVALSRGLKLLYPKE